MVQIREMVSKVAQRGSLVPPRLPDELVRLDLQANTAYPQELGLKRIVAANWLLSKAGDPTAIRAFFYGQYSRPQLGMVKESMNASHLHPGRRVSYVTADQAGKVGRPKIVSDKRLRQLFTDTRGAAIDLVLDFINMTEGENSMLPPEDRKKPFARNNMRRVEIFLRDDRFQEQRELLSLIINNAVNFMRSDGFKPTMERRRTLLVQLHHGQITPDFKREYNEISETIRLGLSKTAMEAWAQFASTHSYDPNHPETRGKILGFSQGSLIRYIN